MGKDWPIIGFIILVFMLAIVAMIAGLRQARRTGQAIREAERVVRTALEVPPRVTVYGEALALAEIREQLSAAIHSCLTEFFGQANDKNYQPYKRYVPLPAANIDVPRSIGYLAIDVELCTGLDAATRRRLLMTLHERLNLPDADIRLLETPGPNWMVNGRIVSEDFSGP